MKHSSKRLMLLLAFALTAIALPSACSLKESDKVEKCAKAFAYDYFNLRMGQAAKMCTSGSWKWIGLRASNITQQDIDALNIRKDTAECEVDIVDASASHATAILKVKNCLTYDSIGKPAYICPSASYTVSMIKKSDVWLVDLTKPLERNKIEE